METPHHEFKVGKLVIHGDTFAFRPEPSLQFSAKPGDAATVYLQYGYEEASPLKELLTLDFTVELDGKTIGTRSTRVEDVRMVNDTQWGLLKQEIPLTKKGTLKGRFTVKALYSKGAWSGKGKPAQTPFLEAGEFTVRVR